ncbi:MAG: hypothetical protein BRC29_01100 [Nanohaloarchaea archaeon SW_7_43_1]|nr:MAG: hypothetical protein BRC29_01100 [Nanohaloarchaea archaeon SW_7_43_1]
MTDTQKTLIDTNILVYSIDSSANPEKRRIAKEIIKSGFEGKEEFYIAVQNLEELATVSTSKIENPISWQEIGGYIEEIINWPKFKIVETTEKSVLNSIEIRKKNNTDYWDAVIASAMKENSIQKIHTENAQDFDQISGIEAENPFK